ncbi:succinate--CoA ligase subunit alpha [Rhodospirillaceae bacterium SYSU D60014]|uniref:succinate--CoA ligase subunit alpha n=1 Tax=Virgifigura deserti TaxID=2268457 RepID=UPI000E664FD9
MIIRKHHKVLVQGITGKQGSFWTEKMMACGTQVVGGVNPKRAGETHVGLPVFASAREAMAAAPYDVAVMFIPPAAAKDAALDAIEAGVKLLVMLTEHIPIRDVMAVHEAARRRGTRTVGPNTAGLVTPGEAFVGIMPGHNPNVFQPGRVGVISRSGSLGTLVCLNLTRAGLGQSAFIGVGGDPMVGTTTRDALEALDRDARTQAVALVGEIGGVMEEDAADYAATMRKPVVAFIAGRAAPPGRKMGHAGAIATANRGGYASKRQALEAAGVTVVDTPGEIAEACGRGLAHGQCGAEQGSLSMEA